MNDFVKGKIRKIKRSYYKIIEYPRADVMSDRIGNDFIYKSISEEKPLMITRLGSVELSAIYSYNSKGEIPQNILNKLNNNAGVFPKSNNIAECFCKRYSSDLSEADIIGVWYNPGEGRVIQKFAQSSNLVELRALEPYYYDNPWSKILENKKVLVIHPFEKSILNQFNKKDLLFQNKSVLPNFKLLTIRSVQSIAGNKTQFDDWFDALDFMCKQIDQCDFDICIIGAGAYGLPLAAHVKRMGKISIHMGGSTQLLFGIKGSRWDNHDFIKKLYNDSWIRPIPEEVVLNSSKVENGCYW